MRFGDDGSTAMSSDPQDRRQVQIGVAAPEHRLVDADGLRSKDQTTGCIADDCNRAAKVNRIQRQRGQSQGVLNGRR
jgi:hypothetical protein